MRVVFLIAACLGSLGLLHAEDTRDLLTFENGDQLHGRYGGMAAGASVLWERDDTAGQVKYASDALRRIILRGGKPIKPLRTLSHVGTLNGDRIPGEVRFMDADRVVIDTAFAGPMEIPRQRVGLLAPNPLGGRSLYHGPYDPEEWLLVNPGRLDGVPVTSVESGKEDATPVWRHSGSAWYWDGKGHGTAIVRKAGMSDRSLLRFDIAWKNRLSCTIGFHADFQRPQAMEQDLKEKERDPFVGAGGRMMNHSSFPEIFGASYVMQIYSNYVMLYRCSFDAEGLPRADRLQASSSSLRLGDSGSATVELRCNRVSGEIMLFVNDQFVVQWSELAEPVAAGQGPGYAGKGEGFGFLVQSEDSPMRVSNVIVAEWNGMPDAARSLQAEDTDIVLLSNGTDRFSGKVTGLSGGKLHLEGRYGDFEFPISEVAEVRFAKTADVPPPAVESGDVKVRMHPIGRITGKPSGGDSDTLRLRSSEGGEIEVDLDYAAMLDFYGMESYLDDWDEEF